MAKFCRSTRRWPRICNDGDTVAFEGFTHLIPHAAAHEAIRQGFRDLTLIRMTPDLIYDQMIGMGMARKMVFSYAGNPGVGLLRRAARRHRERLSARHRDRGAQPRRHGQRLRGGRRAACPARSSAAIVGADLPTVNPDIKIGHLPVHRRGAGGGPGASGPTSPSSMRRRPTGRATCWSRASSASRRKRCWRPSAPW